MRSALLLVSTIAAVACAGDPPPLRDCTPGASLPCACVGSAQGAQLCGADGHLDACVCPDAGPGGDVVDSAAADVVDAAQDVPGLDVAVPLDVPAIDAPDVAVPLDSPAVDHQVTDAAPDAVDANNGDASADASADVADCNTASDPANCGACGRVCNNTHGLVTCSAGECVVVRCGSGYGDCDGNRTNGCEANLANNAFSCGACGHSCDGPHVSAYSCVDSACRIACAPGWCDRDGNVANGCETAC